jgi:hypothetical protein
MTMFTLHIFLMSSLLRSERTHAAWVRRCANSSCELKNAAPIIARGANIQQMCQHRAVCGAQAPSGSGGVSRPGSDSWRLAQAV